jgi:hypothetical protein
VHLIGLYTNVSVLLLKALLVW